MTDHLAKAKDYIAKGDDYYFKAAEAIMAAKEEQPDLTWTEIGRQIGRSHTWVQRLVNARVQFLKTGEFEVDQRSGSNRRDEVARKVLSDPRQRREVIESLKPAEVEGLVEAVNDVALQRARTRYSEQTGHNVGPTPRELMGDERFDPSESWADTLIMRVHTNALELARHVKKWGVVISALGEPTAFEYLQQAERELAEVRVALQERIRDGEQVEA